MSLLDVKERRKAQKASPAMLLVEHVWGHCGEKGRDSYRTLNASMIDALSLAITSGMQFARDDFTYIANRFNFGYWCGNDGHMSGERFYSAACKADNLSAAQSFEAWKGRRPFIVKGDVAGSGSNGRVYIHKDLYLNLEPKPARPVRWEVSSFSESGDAFVVIQKVHEFDERGYVTRTKVKRRQTIDRDRFAELHGAVREKERAARKAKRDALASVVALRKSQSWFKVLKKGQSFHGGDYKWPLPVRKGDVWEPGAWVSLGASEYVEFCVKGFHITRSPHLWQAEGATTYLVEVPAECFGSTATFQAGSDKAVVSKCRLLRPLTAEELLGLATVGDEAEAA